MGRKRIRRVLVLALFLTAAGLGGCIGSGQDRRMDRERDTHDPLRGEHGVQQQGNKAGASWGVRF